MTLELGGGVWIRSHHPMLRNTLLPELWKKKNCNVSSLDDINLEKKIKRTHYVLVAGSEIDEEQNDSSRIANPNLSHMIYI